MQPGEIITPGEQKDETVEITIPRNDTAPKVENPPVTPESPASVVPPAEPLHEIAKEQIEQFEEPSPWAYAQESSLPQPTNDLNPISWSASEFVEHQKDKSWFVGFAGLTVLIVAVIYLITQELITAVVILITAGLFAVSARRKPQTLEYLMDQSGITIGGKFYAYETFKSFSVFDDEAFSSIQLTSLKRFAIPVSLYYPPEEEEKIIAMLGNFLPHEERSHDPVDRLMRKVRF